MHVFPRRRLKISLASGLRGGGDLLAIAPQKKPIAPQTKYGHPSLNETMYHS